MSCIEGKHSGFHYWLTFQSSIGIGLDPWIKKRVNYLSCIEGRHSGFHDWLKFQPSIGIGLDPWIKKKD